MPVLCNNGPPLETRMILALGFSSQRNQPRRCAQAEMFMCATRSGRTPAQPQPTRRECQTAKVSVCHRRRPVVRTPLDFGSRPTTDKVDRDISGNDICIVCNNIPDYLFVSLFL